RLMPRGCGSVFSFELDGDRAAGRRFVEALRLFSHLANVGDARSLVIHPATTMHFRMDAAALAAAGIGEGTLRLSIGLEDPADLIADLEAAFRAAARGCRELRSGTSSSTSAASSPTPAGSNSIPTVGTWFSCTVRSSRSATVSHMRGSHRPPA